jgi:hypothetical protein
MQIGDIVLPAMNSFEFNNTRKSTKHLAGLGDSGFKPAEFTPDIPGVTFGGKLLQTYGSTRSLLYRAEDLSAMAERNVGYNYINSVRGKKGFLSISSVSPSPNNGQLWPYSGEGAWYDAAWYTLKFHCKPVQMANTLSIASGNLWVAVPKGAVYSGGDGVTSDVSTEDGTIKLVRCNTSNISFDLAGNDSANGEVRCYDGTTQVYLSSHLFSGTMAISNGLYKIVLSANTVTVYYWNGSAYVKIDDFVCGSFSRWWLTSCTPDKIAAKTNSGLTVEVERGRVPYVYSPSTMTCTALTPANQSTSTGTNYLTLGTSMYIAGNDSFSIASKVISSGHHWIFYDSGGTQAQQAKDVLMISNLRRSVVMR